MLYDPKWEKPEVKADPYSLDSLIAWLEKQPTERTYVWASDNCLLCQYLEAMGENKYTGYGQFPVDLRCAIVQHPVKTFGAALDRARAQR